MMTDVRGLAPRSHGLMAARKLGGAGVALALAAGLSACAGGPNGPATRIYSPLLDTAYSPGEINGGSLASALEMKGAPPDGSDIAAVAAAMQMPPSFGSGGFRPATAQDLQGPRAVVIFNPDGRTGACAGEVSGRGGEGRNGRTEALVAWCGGTKELSSLMMSSGATLGPKDEGFVRAMSQAMMQLLPMRNPAQEGGRGRYQPSR